MADENILEPMKQVTAEGLRKELQGNIAILQSAANIFLTNVQNILESHQHILQQEKNGTSSLMDIYKLMKTSTNITRQCIQQQYIFEQSLNAFLGRTILLLYVTKEGETLYGDEVTSAEIYQKAQKTSTGSRGTVKMNKTRQNELRTNPIEIVQKYKDLIARREILYKPIREQVINRWQDNHQDKYGWVEKFPNLKDTFYWLKNENTKNFKEKWDWSTTVNRGHIEEAYASLIWESKEEKILNANDVGVKEYWDYMQSHKILNATSGIVKGDVTFFLDPAIQFAVKSGNFSTAALGTYIDVAYQISFGTIPIDKNMITILLDNIASYSNAVRNYGRQEAEKRLNEIIRSTGGQIN